MTPQEVIKEILLHIDSLEMSEATEAVRCHTGGDAGYVKALNDMRAFIKKRFRDAAEKVEPKEVELKKDIDAFFDKWDKNSYGCIFDENGARVTIETIKGVVKRFLNARKGRVRNDT